VTVPRTPSTALAAVRSIVAVVGCQRSGTTLTGQILGAHPDAVLLDEPDGVYPWFEAEARGTPDAETLAAAAIARARSKYRDPASRFVRSGDAVALAPSVHHLILKAPNLTYDDDLAARFPRPVTIVYPVRDPRAVVASMRRLSGIDFVGNQCRLLAERRGVAERYAGEMRVMAEEEEPPHVRMAVLWRVKSGRAGDFRARGLSVAQLRYEDLVTAPRDSVERLLEACGLPASDAAHAPHAAYVGEGPGGTDRTRAVDRASLARWRDALSSAEARDVIAAAEPLASTFGYA
jgi:hypothetical protein